MKDKDQSSELFSLADQYLANGMDFETIKEKLLQRYNDEELILMIISKTKKDYYNKRRKEGTSILGIGLTMILVGFVLTCFNYHTNQSVNFVMYGLTSIGILIVLWGLYKILG